MRSAGMLSSVLAFAIGCGPPQLGAPMHTDDGSTSEEGTDSSSSSSTESSTTETGEPQTTASFAGTFIPAEDAELPDCDPWEQNCPEGEKCVPYGSTGGNWDAHKCVPIMGDQAPGEPCIYGGVVEATDDCDETSHCWDVMEVDGQPVGVCTLFCTGMPDEPECPPKHYCIDDVVNLCVKSCDPILQDCGEGLACFWANANFNCIFTTQDIPAGQPCGFINDCAAGLACLTAEVLPGCEGSACCSGFCDLNLGDGPCAALLPGTVCLPFFEEGMAPEGYDHVGVCILTR